jgi:hypothetical protein
VPIRPLAVALSLVLALGTVAVVREVTGGASGPVAFDTAAVAVPRVAEPTTTTTAAPSTTTTTAEPVPAPETTTSTAAPAPEPVLQAAATTAADLTVYSGLGTWVDVYDWSETFNRYAEHRVGVADVDRMAEVGVQTLYIQTSKWDAPAAVLEPERLLPIVQRAKERGIAVVAWYLPTFEDPRTDMHRLMEAARIPGVDALAVDIESLKLKDVDERNRRLIEISTNLRAALPHTALGAIPYPPVVTDVINPNLWPRFPWAELAPLYDIWLPMSYQSDRKADSGYRDGYRYTGENIDRMRANLGRDVPVHTIGGIADRTSPDDVAGIIRAATERRVVGGSLYDWQTTAPELWSHLQPFRNPAR